MEFTKENKVTVITVVFNDVEKISKTIDSVLLQKNIDLQYILMDGGSKDGTLDIIRSYSEKNPEKIDYFSESDKGMYDALNKALKIASGEFICLINSGDCYIKDNAISSALSLLNNNKCNFFFSDVYYGSSFEKSKRVKSGISKFPILGLGYFHTSIICTSDFYKKIGPFSLKYRIAADADWLMRCLNSKYFRPIKGEPILFMDNNGMSEGNLLASFGEYSQALMNNGFGRVVSIFSFLLRSAISFGRLK